MFRSAAARSAAARRAILCSNPATPVYRIQQFMSLTPSHRPRIKPFKTLLDNGLQNSTGLTDAHGIDGTQVAETSVSDPPCSLTTKAP